MNPVRGLTSEEDGDAEAEGNKRQTFCFYYLLPLPDSSVIIVTNSEDLHKCLNRLTKPFTTIGIDAEWNPAMHSVPSEHRRQTENALVKNDHQNLLPTPSLDSMLNSDPQGSSGATSPGSVSPGSAPSDASVQMALALQI